MKGWLLFWAGWLLVSSSFSQSISNVVVTGGRIAGYTEDTITIFKGIPFAAPPVGSNRWKPPQPVIPWDCVLTTDRFALPCPQYAPILPNVLKISSSEDCLYLNVWTPAKSTDDRFPVMVWIYGGGFALGSTSTPLYDGTELARMGVVVVSIAYRVGALGFLSHPWLSKESPEGVSGNYGLLDQIAGLKWVQENITAFGGNPQNVTVFGESAGGISVSMLCASPLAKGLFQKAICQSGGNFGPISAKRTTGTIQNLASAEQSGLAFSERLGAHSLDALRTLKPEKWRNDSLAQMGGFWPVVDGYVLPGDQYQLYQAGQYNDIPVLLGTNSDEGSLFVAATSVQKFRAKAEELFGPFASKALELYPANTRKQTRIAMADIVRETLFAWPTWAWATLQTQTGHSPVYLYYFSYPAKILPFLGGKPRGAGHGSDIRFVFRTLKKGATETEKILSKTMAAYWTNFAKTGNPNGAELPEWPVYQTGKPTVLYLDQSVQSGPVPNIEQLLFVEDYFNWKRGQQ